MPVYATPAELATYLDPDAPEPVVPPLASVLLRMASALVADAIAAARYAVDAAELPTKPDLLAAVKAATCEQAAAWSVNNIDPRKGTVGLKPIVTTKSLGGQAVSYGQSAAIQAATVALAAAQDLTAPALAILDLAGLLSNRVTTGGLYAAPGLLVVS